MPDTPLSSNQKLPRKPEWEQDGDHIRFFGRPDKPEGVLIERQQAAIALWGYEEARADYWQAESARLTARVAELEQAVMVTHDENDRLRGVNTYFGGKTEKERECDRLRAALERIREKGDIWACREADEALWEVADETTGEQE